MTDLTEPTPGEEPLEPELERLARSYHEPPATPRDAMWARIEAARTTAASRPAVVPLRRRALWIGAPLATAAVLALGVALGRWTRSSSSGATPAPAIVATAPEAIPVARQRGDVAYRLVATQYLGQSEEFLTLFRSSARDGQSDALATATARHLLATNRLLLDSPAGSDPRMRALLQDLELVLAQIAQLRPTTPHQDLNLITDGMERGAVLIRLRAAVPAGSALLNQGAL
jgi:uncharacterized lipoprotein YbaY